MIRTLSRAGLIVAVACSPGCVSTSMQSTVSDRDAATALSRIMVWFPIEDADLRRAAEDEVVRGADDRFVPAYTILAPGASLSALEMARAAMDAEVDGVLVIDLSESGSSRSDLPEDSEYFCTGGSAAWCSGTSTRTGGYSVEKPWATFRAQLVRLSAEGEVLWQATAETEGNAYSEAADLFLSVAHRTAERLVSDGVSSGRR